MNLREDLLTLTVTCRKEVAKNISEFTLALPDGSCLPTFTPGAHITVETPSGAMRRYSLINDGAKPTVYVIGIKREAASRGGSSSMHDSLMEGDTIRVETPENDFELAPASKYLLIAGGIGITPILSMARQIGRAHV